MKKISLFFFSMNKFFALAPLTREKEQLQIPNATDSLVLVYWVQYTMNFGG